MKRLMLGFIVALSLGVTLLAQAGLEVTFTINDDTVFVLKQVIAKRQNLDPATVTDTQVRNGVLTYCRESVMGQVRAWRREQDKPALDALFNDLTEAERAQVRAYILGLVK